MRVHHDNNSTRRSCLILWLDRKDTAHLRRTSGRARMFERSQRMKKASKMNIRKKEEREKKRDFFSCH
jgi:hypothetical protein